MKIPLLVRLCVTGILLGCMNTLVLAQDSSEEFVKTIMQGDVEAVEKLIDGGMDVNMVK